MIIFCSGMPRSASTWSYNVCYRLLLEQSQESLIHASFSDDFRGCVDRLDGSQRDLLLKCHRLDPLARSLILLKGGFSVYTYRNPFDAIVSSMRMFDQSFETAYTFVASSLDLFRFHKEAGLQCCLIPYTQVVNAPLMAVTAIQELLGIQISAALLEQISSETGLENMRRISDGVESEAMHSVKTPEGLSYDRRTLLHRNHIRDGSCGYGRRMLSAEQQRQVETTFAELLAVID